MSDLITRLLPLLPRAWQSQQLAEAASHFNHLAEQLVYARNPVHERALVREFMRMAEGTLQGPDLVRGESMAAVADHMSIVFYLRSVDHWAVDWAAGGRCDAGHWVGALLHSAVLRHRQLGSIMARLQEEGAAAALMLANTVAKLLDSPEEDTLAVGLRMALDHLTEATAALLAPGIVRALRSRQYVVRMPASLAPSAA